MMIYFIYLFLAIWNLKLPPRPGYIRQMPLSMKMSIFHFNYFFYNSFLLISFNRYLQVMLVCPSLTRMNFISFPLFFLLSKSFKYVMSVMSWLTIQKFLLHFNFSVLLIVLCICIYFFAFQVTIIIVIVFIAP